MKSILQSIKTDVLIAPKSQTNSATTTANLDTVDATHGKADYVRLVLSFASEINTNAVGPTISVLQSDDTVVTNFATILANRTDEDLTGARSLTYNIDMRGKKRYLRLSVTTATTTNDTITYAATYDLLHEQSPTGTADIADASVIV